MAAPRQADTVIALGVEISVFAHATEEEEKVEQAVLNIIPMGVGANPKIQRLRGHYNDPIVLMTTRIRKRKAAREVFRSLIHSLSSLDRRRLTDEVEDRVDEAGNLYVRLDKQSAYHGRVVLHESDPIHVKIKFHIPHGVNPFRAVQASIAAIIDEIEQSSDKQYLKVD